MPQPPPRKVKPSAQLKTLHTEQVSKLNAKHQQECDLLEDIRSFARQRSVIEKEYAQITGDMLNLCKNTLYNQWLTGSHHVLALLKLTGQLLKRDFQAMPDLSSEDGQEQRTAMAVWRVILEETDILAKKRLLAAETYLERIAEPIKPLKTTKIHCMKKVSPQLTTIQNEVSQTVVEMCKAQKVYNVDETQANDARLKAKEAEDKLNKKSKGIFTSLASLQKNYAKLKTRMDACESKATEGRNEYILCMSAANAHHVRYFTTDLPNLMEILDGEVFERIQEYFAIYGNTAQEISCYENRSFNRIVEQTAMINRNYDLKCFLYANKIFTDLVQYEFEPCLEDKCNIISGGSNAGHLLDKEARKWATKIAKETKAIKDYQKTMKMLSSGEKGSETGSTEGVSQDPEAKMEELQQNIRRAETAKAKAEARIEALRKAGVNVDEWLASANIDSLGVDEDMDIPRTPSRTSVSSSHTDDQEPTYTNYDEDDDFLDDTFDVTVTDYTQKSNQSKYPTKCRSIYEFQASNADELDMMEGEELQIIAGGEGDGWVRAMNSKGVCGYIPENYIVTADDDNESETTPTGTIDEADKTVAAMASTVSVDSGSIVQAEPKVASPTLPVSPTSPPAIITTDESDDFPPPPMSPAGDQTQEVTSYSSNDMEVQQTTCSMNNTGMQLPVGDGQWVRALYDYEGTTNEELSFVEGTLIRLINRDENGIDDGFWEGEANGRVGVFPSLMVEELASPGLPQEFPSPLISPPDYMPPPPVTVTEATPDSDTPPTPIANGSVPEDAGGSQAVDMRHRKVTYGRKAYYRNCYNYNKSSQRNNNKHNHHNAYDPTYDDDGEESLV